MLIIAQVCVRVCVNSSDFVLSMCMRMGMHVYVCVFAGPN